MRKAIWITVAVLSVVLWAQCAHADSFEVSGTAINDSGGSLGTCAIRAICSFSGTLTIDVTGGTATAVDITFPGLASFTSLVLSTGFGTSNWFIDVGNGGAGIALLLDFTTTKTPGSLVGFTGGTIFGNTVFNVETGNIYYTINSGSITAATAAPEPGSLVLMLLGLGALAFATGRRRVWVSARPSAV